MTFDFLSHWPFSFITSYYKDCQINFESKTNQVKQPCFMARHINIILTWVEKILIRPLWLLLIKKQHFKYFTCLFHP
jgi:hypothetical protein